MGDRIPDDLFYDPEVVGAHVIDTEAGTIGTTSVEERTFYMGDGDATRGSLPILLWRIAVHPFRLAAVLLAMGFFAVFIQQAPVLYQIVLGAPIFEEFLKFGLAMVIGYPLRSLGLRLPVAAAVGAGFGVLEHWTTYADENTVQYGGRIAFHAGATALSMIAYHAVDGIADVRARFFTTLPATLIHYVNNALAVLTIALLPAGLDVVEAVGSAISTALIVILYVAIIWLLADPFTWRGWVARRTAALWGQPQGSRGPESGTTSQVPWEAVEGPEDNWPMRRS